MKALTLTIWKELRHSKMTTQDELPVRSLPPSDKPLPQLGPHQPAPAGPFPGPHGKPGGKYQEDGTKEKGKIYRSVKSHHA